jgi:hypothetical protein
MIKILYFFPDTNLFIQCRPLEQLDWSTWVSSDEIHLIVSRPVQREIDNLKDHGRDRVKKQARKISSIFRDIITGADGYKLVLDIAPQVKLFIESSCLPSPELTNRLDYSKSDDELVGCLHAYRASNPKLDARLLTHDTGPMGTAKMLSIPFVEIPGNWLLPPESTDIERENKRLASELERLKKVEPCFKIACIDDRKNKFDSLNSEYHQFEPLEEHEISEFMDMIKVKIPLATNFHPKEPDNYLLPGLALGLRIGRTYVSPTDDEITKYRDDAYPAWLNKCKSILRNLHITLQHETDYPLFNFEIVNEGNRPGKDVLVTFTAKGDFKIRPEKSKGDLEQGSENSSKINIRLPAPPVPPQGRWRENLFGYPNHTGIHDLTKPHLEIGSHTLTSLYSTPAPRDPNGFYYKPSRSIIPVESFSLECAQWRHSIEPKLFKGEIIFDWNHDEIKGAITCHIHAENLSDPVSKILPVTITIRRLNIRERANELVVGLLGSAGIPPKARK